MHPLDERVGGQEEPPFEDRRVVTDPFLAFGARRQASPQPFEERRLPGRALPTSVLAHHKPVFSTTATAPPARKRL